MSAAITVDWVFVAITVDWVSVPTLTVPIAGRATVPTLTGLAFGATAPTLTVLTVPMLLAGITPRPIAIRACSKV